MKLDQNELQKSLKAVHCASLDKSFLKKILSLIDLTSLNETDTPEHIAELCKKAVTPYGHVAAVCIYPQFVKQAVKALAGKPVKIATVANFPHGDDTFEVTVTAIKEAVSNGAHEIDVVFPYKRYLAGNREVARAFIQACKTACGHHALLKVIMETEMLHDAKIISEASYEAVLGGADFLKTCTGKIGEGATLEAAGAMLLTLRNIRTEIKRTVGFKASGGIRTVEQAKHFVELAQHIMGMEWVTPETFRIGASKLVDEVLAQL